MDTPPRSGSGAPVARCADDDACTVVSCAVCLKEIPADAARLTDAQDYVHHFCGLDCLEAWRKQAASRAR
ncbi:MAG: DUF3330 domain-containing protein [Gammaproteobacteria bacterium]